MPDGNPSATSSGTSQQEGSRLTPRRGQARSRRSSSNASSSNGGSLSPRSPSSLLSPHIRLVQRPPSPMARSSRQMLSTIEPKFQRLRFQSISTIELEDVKRSPRPPVCIKRHSLTPLNFSMTGVQGPQNFQVMGPCDRTNRSIGPGPPSRSSPSCI